MQDKASSKRANLVATPREHCGRTLNIKKCHFLALPPEIRAMIYVYAFSDEWPRQVPGTHSGSISMRNDCKTKTSAIPKRSLEPGLARRENWVLASIFPLLLTNKFICDEATPMVYTYHTFSLAMPTIMRGVPWYRKTEYLYNGSKARSLHQSLSIQAYYGQLITRLELEKFVGSFSSFWEDSWGHGPDLPSLTASFPNLRLLRLSIKPVGAWDPRHAHWTQFAADKQEIWNQLLARLDHLEFAIWHFGDEGIHFREAIAPGSRWVQKISAVALQLSGPHFFPAFRTVLKSVWSLQRSSMPKQGAHQVGQILEAIT